MHELPVPSLLRALSTAALLSATASGQASIAGAGPTRQVVSPAAGCAPAIQDAAQPGACIVASSVPTSGALLPLGPELFVEPTGEVGIGTMSPEHALDVAGDLRAGRCAFGNQGSIGPGTSYDWLFDFTASITDFSTAPANIWEGLSSWITIDPDQDLTGTNATTIFSHDLYVYTAEGNDKDIEYLQGPYLRADHYGTGSIAYFGGALITTWAFDGRTGRQSGSEVVSGASGPAIVGDNYGVECRSGHGGFGSIENDYSLHVWSPHATGTLENHYGIYLEDQDFGQQDSYAIYSAGGTTYLAGDLGLGTDTPTAKLDVAGDFVASGTKSFVEPHPLDPTKEIRFVCLEGNEAGTYFRGTARLEGGVATIPVPQEFALVTEREGLTVQVTALGPGGELWVAAKGLSWIEVRGERDVEFDYLVNGVRHGYADFAVVRDRAQRASAASKRPRGLASEEIREMRHRAVRAGGR